MHRQIKCHAETWWLDAADWCLVQCMTLNLIDVATDREYMFLIH